MKSISEFLEVGGRELRLALDERLAQLRTQLEDLTRSEIDTCVLRGRIAELKSILAPPPPKMEAAPGYGVNRKVIQ